MVGIKCLKKVLMFRGSSLDALKVELFEKKWALKGVWSEYCYNLLI